MPGLKESRRHVRGGVEEWGFIRKQLEGKGRAGTEITPGLIRPGDSNVFRRTSVYFNTLIKWGCLNVKSLDWLTGICKLYALKAVSLQGCLSNFWPQRRDSEMNEGKVAAELTVMWLGQGWTGAGTAHFESSNFAPLWPLQFSCSSRRQQLAGSVGLWSESLWQCHR